jgi:hypothetical protein
MVLGERRIAIPSFEEIGVPKLREVVAEIEAMLGREIPLEEWDRL